MKKLFISIIIFSCMSSIVTCTWAQNPELKVWDYRYGGTWFDELTYLNLTPDGGYILGGRSNSALNGNKSEASWGMRDFWIVKLDSMGIMQWDKDLGGTDEDLLFSMQRTFDGGYILGGYSYSNSSGDKTQNSQGLADFWIVKTDSLGNKLWDKDFGGVEDDMPYALQQTSDAGYIIGGWSESDSSGDKTQDAWGLYDYWVVKIDSLGNKEWDKDFGGSSNDQLYTLQQTTDGGYILGGKSSSPVSGNKTEPTWGALDYWIVKLDSLGNKQWEKSIGGTLNDHLFNLQQTTDGGFILGGISSSGIGGNKTQSIWGGGDYWIVKTDSLGNVLWDRDFGGTLDEDDFGNISQVINGEYLIAGASYSNVSGNKTENNLGMEQSWILKTDALGNLLWDKTLFTLGHNETGRAIQTTKDSCYVFANFDNGGVGGYRTQPAWGDYDYWIIKFCDSTALPEGAFTANDFLCPGTCTDFINLSTRATSFQWSFPGGAPDTSTAVNPISICYANPGMYDVQLITTNLNGRDTLLFTNFITVYPTSPQSITQTGDTLIATTGAASYQWYFDTTLISGATESFYVALQSGDYSVMAIDINGCESGAAISAVIANEKSFENVQVSLKVYPNPVAEEISVRNSLLEHPEAILSIFNFVGEKISPDQTRINEKELKIDVRAIPSGIYFLEIRSTEKTSRAKFVKQ